MLRVAVIGLGPIGNLHAEIYREDPLAELVGVCDLLADRRQAGAERHGVPGFASAREMLAALKPDLVSVATGGVEYGSDHMAPTLEALEAGCHVLCEKPISNEVADAERMVTAAAAAGLCLAVDFNHRFTPAAWKAKQWLDEGKLGHLLFANMSLWIGNPAESSPWFHLKALHPHSLEMLQYFVGPVKAVQCFGHRAPGRSIWSTIHMSLEFECGAVGGLTGSYDIVRGHPMERCEVAGVKGRFVLEDMWRQSTLYPADSWDKTVYTNPVFGGMRDFGDTFRNRIHRYLEQLTEGAKPTDIDGSGLQALRAQRVIACAIESLKTRTIVEVPTG